MNTPYMNTHRASTSVAYAHRNDTRLNSFAQLDLLVQRLSQLTKMASNFMCGKNNIKNNMLYGHMTNI